MTNADMITLGKQIGAKYDGEWPWKGATFYQFTDSVTGSTVMGPDADTVRRRIDETRKAFEAAKECK